MNPNQNALEHFSIPGKVTLSQDEHHFWKVNVETTVSTAEIYLQGAHVTSFQKKGDAPLLFMSASARIDRAHMLHGGIPLCFPWFGNRHGETLSHGFARISLWDLVETKAVSEDKVLLRFQLPPSVLIAGGWAPVHVELSVIVGETLTLELFVENKTEELFCYEECLHSYFFVGDINKATIHGLHGLTYLDKNEDLVSKLETADELPIVGETNSIYLNSSGTLEIHDGSLKRTIRIQKENSYSTVVWNPWSEKAKSIPDFNPEDYQKMLCVEAGNVGERVVKLLPGEGSKIRLILSTLVF